MAAYRGLTVSYQNLFRLPLTYYHLSAKIYKLCFNSFKVLRGRIYKTSIIKNTPLDQLPVIILYIKIINIITNIITAVTFSCIVVINSLCYPLKTSENLWLSDVFRGYRKRPSGMKWVK